jgi:hypothetical protein
MMKKAEIVSNMAYVKGNAIRVLERHVELYKTNPKEFFDNFRERDAAFSHWQGMHCAYELVLKGLDWDGNNGDFDPYEYQKELMSIDRCLCLK